LNCVLFDPISDETLLLKVETAEPERLDRWLTANIKQLSRNRIQKLIDWEYVHINDQL
jgi:23S rRNA pseudouridine1911/1915/1917 synthase